MVKEYSDHPGFVDLRIYLDYVKDIEDLLSAYLINRIFRKYNELMIILKT